MSFHRLTAVALVAVLSLLGIACSPQEPDVTPEEQVAAEDRPGEEPANGEPADDAAPGETLTYVSIDNDFTEFPTSAPAGTVTMELVNDGNLHHDVTIEELGDRIVVEADAGETATGTVDLDPGEYTVYCSVPGHRATMEETLVVE